MPSGARPRDNPGIHIRAKERPLSEPRAEFAPSDAHALVDRLERAERRARILVEVGELFGAGRPIETSLRGVAGKCCEDFADLVLIHALDAHGTWLATSAVESRFPPLAEAIRAHLASAPIRFDEPVAARQVIESGQGIFLPEVTPADIARLTRPVDVELMGLLGIRSAIVVPLTGRQGTVGTMDFVLVSPGRSFDREDRSLAEEIGGRVAAAIENARLVERLESERALLAQVLEHLPAGVVIEDGAGKLVLSNRIADGVVGFGMQSSLPAVRAEQVVRRKADGAELPVVVNSACVHGKSGEVVARVAVFQDVSEDRRVRARLEELAHMAAARARHLEEIIARIADGVLVSDAAGRIVHANEAAAKLFGTTREALLRPIGEFRKLFQIRAPGDSDPAMPIGARALQGLVVVGSERTIVDATTGDERCLRLSAAPLRAPSGEIDGAVLVACDITGFKALDRAKDEFLSIASHELKTPLTPLLALAEFISRKVSRGDPVERDTASRLPRLVKRLQGLVEDLLDVARAREGRLEIAPRRLAIGPVLERIIDEYRTSLRSHEIAWIPADFPVVVNVDEARLAEVVLNLLENATKYSPEGGRISVTLTRAGQAACVSVRDPGIGIPREDVPLLFERFRRARNASTGNFGGFGLGLFIAREIVRLHGGEIVIESAERAGTCVSFTLPLAEDAPADVAAAEGRFARPSAPHATDTAPAVRSGP